MNRTPDPAGDLYLLESSRDGTYLLRSTERESGGNHHGHRFWILDDEGKVVAEYAPEFYCDCEVGYPVIYDLRDGTLFRLSGRDNDASTRALTRWNEIEIVCHVAWQLGPDDREWRALRGGGPTSP